MQIAPIRSADDHRAALAEIEALWGATEGSDEGDRLDAIIALVDSYEARRWPLDVDASFDPVEVIRFAIDELGHGRAELAQILGSRSRASEILARRRALTVPMIHAISQAWKIPAELLVRPYPLTKAG
jgi:HTH-type transcriptional regulator/antitoxin HigA